MNAKTEAAVMEHGKQLLAIFPSATERDPVKLCRKLRKLEREGAAPAGKLLEVPAFWRRALRGETKREQVPASELLAGFLEPARAAAVERAQLKLGGIL